MIASVSQAFVGFGHPLNILRERADVMVRLLDGAESAAKKFRPAAEKGESKTRLLPGGRIEKRIDSMDALRDFLKAGK